MSDQIIKTAPMTPQEKRVLAALLICVCAVIALWIHNKDIQSRWINVPPPPSQFSAAGSGLGDVHFAYRKYGITLQNIGDTGGRVTSLNDYNYDNVAAWFRLLHRFDFRSNFIPFLAAYYYGSVSKDKHRLRPLVLYLADAGNSQEGEKWRWLAQATYLARFAVKDMDLALSLSEKLGKLNHPNMPAWARHMRANVLNARGEKEAAYGMLIGILENSADSMHPNEVNATLAYICEQILTPEQNKNNSLCEEFPPVE